MFSSGSTQDELLPTRDSLLSRLRDLEDRDSWQDFFQTYWKLVYQVARQAGLDHHESEEVVQETVITVSKHIPAFKYDPAVCSFKTWLMNLTRWRIIDQVRRRRRAGMDGSLPQEAGTRTDLILRVADPQGVDIQAVWEEEWRHHLLQQATQRVKARVSPEQYQIFHLCTVKEWPVSQVTAELGVSRGSVYLAKHRVSALLRKEIRALERRLQ